MFPFLTSNQIYSLRIYIKLYLIVYLKMHNEIKSSTIFKSTLVMLLCLENSMYFINPRSDKKKGNF